MPHDSDNKARWARPRYYMREDLSPFAQLLVDWMRYHGIVAQRELSPLLGLSQQTISSYFKPASEKPSVPAPLTLQRISEKTSIPLATLYLSAGYPVYEPAPRPDPRRHAQAHDAPQAPALDQWEDMYRRIEALPIPREAREELLTLAENKRRGYDPMRRHIIAEHVVESAPLPPHTSPAPTQARTPPDTHAFAPTGGDEEE